MWQLGMFWKKVNDLHIGEFEALSVAEDRDSQVLHRASGIMQKAITGLSFQANE